MSLIKFVYFDVGGVLLLDYSGTSKWVEMKRALGVNEAQDVEFDLIWKKYRERICVDCDVDTIVHEFKRIAGVSIPDGYSMLDDFVTRFEPNPSIWPVAAAAKQKYQVGLLTNMYPRMLAAILEKNLIPDVEWNSTVDSSEIGYQKPEVEIFQKAEELAGAKPEEIFFADNSEEHVTEAAKRGWRTFLYDPQNPEESSIELAKVLDLVTVLK
jgi:HAD superfamily hydrolase (TIGR01509 family)